jgi:hypothetical protein
MADHVFAANISAAPNGTTMTSKQGVPLTKGPDVRPGSRQQHARRNQASTNKKEDVEVLRWRIQSPETSHAVPVTTNAAPARTPIARTAETQVISRSEILDGLTVPFQAAAPHDGAGRRRLQAVAGPPLVSGMSD